eukprot:scaffold121861_cov72-Phaeocystis_antarctica.AAC.2
MACDCAVVPITGNCSYTHSCTLGRPFVAEPLNEMLNMTSCAICCDGLNGGACGGVGGCDGGSGYSTSFQWCPVYGTSSADEPNCQKSGGHADLGWDDALRVSLHPVARHPVPCGDPLELAFDMAVVAVRDEAVVDKVGVKVQTAGAVHEALGDRATQTIVRDAGEANVLDGAELRWDRAAEQVGVQRGEPQLCKGRQLRRDGARERGVVQEDAVVEISEGAELSGDRAREAGILKRKPAPETDQRAELGGERARHRGALSARERQEVGQPEEIEVGLRRIETKIILHSADQRPAERRLRDVEEGELLERVVLRREHAADSRMAQLEKAQLRDQRELRRECAAEARLP